MTRAMLSMAVAAAVAGCTAGQPDPVADEPARNPPPGATAPPRSLAPPPHVDDPVPTPSEAALRNLPFDPSGTYRRAYPEARMRVRPRGDGWDVYLIGEAVPGQRFRPSTCTVLAAGKLEGKTIVAKVVPFRSGLHTVYDWDLPRIEGEVRVTFDGRGAEVTELVVDDICGIGSDLSGAYRK